ncbi:MAG: hypothetical protein LBR73_01600 [Oscillospiraceae bacterium]|nr:hypothetical protein [Oscillospiraceae bacterium]
MFTAINDDAQALLAQDAKIALLAVKGTDGYPHITFLSSLQGLGEKELTFGQFMTGLSKEFLPLNPDCAFVAISADKKWLRGNARYTHKETGGPEFEMYNSKPLFRYNTYFGINTVWYLALKGISAVEPIPMGSIVAGALVSKAAAIAGKYDVPALSRISCELFADLMCLKFLSYFDSDGNPQILPVIQATHSGSSHIIMSGIPFGAELAAIPVGSKVACMAVNMSMESVLVKGSFKGKQGAVYTLAVEKVYNSMPTCNGYIYPRERKPSAVEAF